MARVAISCTDLTVAKLQWLCNRTQRKASNLISLLINEETERQLKVLPEKDKLEVYEHLAGAEKVSTK